MEETPTYSGLYIPYCTEEDGLSQPISTALSLDAGKNLCVNHFLQHCRTMIRRLPSGTGADPALPDRTGWAWNQSPTGVYVGQPGEKLAPPFAAMAGATYQLRPAG